MYHQDEFRIERDYELEEKWEEGILDSYCKALETKVNQFCAALDWIERDFRERYHQMPPDVVKPKETEDDAIRWRVALSNALQDFYSWGSVSLTDFEQILRGLSFTSRSWLGRAVRRCIDWLLNKIIPFFKSFASHLRVRSWSIGGSGGVPAGLSISISVSFEP